MTNLDSARGFLCVGRFGGGEADRKTYPVDASNGTAIFKGDAVRADADGNITPAPNGVGNALLGVAEGLLDETRKPISFLPANTAGFALVIHDPEAKFIIQADSGTVVNETDRFATVDFVSSAGDTVLGISRYELDSSNIGTGNQMRIMDKYDIEDNEFGEEHVDLIIKFTEHVFLNSTTI